MAKLAIKTNLLCGIVFITILSLFSRPIIGLFIKDTETAILDMASQGAIFASIAFLFNGFNIFSASYFTAIDRADISLLIAALRGLVFLAPLILLMPKIWGIDGIWFTIPIAEMCTAIVAFILIRKNITEKLKYDR